MANNINCTCGHSWSKASSSKKDMYVCHICGKDNTMEDGGWLNKFEQGGMNLEQKGDNYGIKPNPNEVDVSMGPDFIGLGYDTTGRNYSPAWGGQFQSGGRLPIITSDPKDPRFQAYRDSLDLYNRSMHNHKQLMRPDFSLSLGGGEGNPGARYIPVNKKNSDSHWANNYKRTFKSDEKDGWLAYAEDRALLSKTPEPELKTLKLKSTYDISKRSKIRPVKNVEYNYGEGPYGGIYETNMLFKKPVQPVEYKKSEETKTEETKSTETKETKPTKPTKTEETKPATYTPKGSKKYIVNGIEVSEEDFLGTGNTTGGSKRIIYSTPKLGTQKVLRLDGTPETDPEKIRKAMRAQEKDGDMAMGGSLPGAVGFTYARTINPAPSNGKYAKKTKASAQDGKKLKNVKGESEKFLKGWMDSPMYNKMINASINASPNQQEEVLKAISREDQLKKMSWEFADLDANRSWLDKLSSPILGQFVEDKNKVLLNPSSNNDKLSEVGVHELSHATDLAGANIPSADVEKMWKYQKQHEQEKGKLTKFFDDKDFNTYVGRPTETRARLNAIRYLGKKEGIYDPYREKVNKDILKKLPSSIFHPTELDQLRLIYSDDQIIDLLNSVSKNDSNELIPQAQNGQEMKFYQEGLDFKPNSIAQDGRAVKDETMVKKPITTSSIVDSKKQTLQRYAREMAQKEQPTLSNFDPLLNADARKQLYKEAEQNKLNNQLLKGADVATDLMQLGNFVPNPVGQLIGNIGNVTGGLIDSYQAYNAYDKGDYGDAAINLASVALPMTLGSSTFRRNSKYLQPGQPLNFLKGSTRVNYIEPFTNVRGMTNKSLMANRALLGTLGAETAYDSYQDGGAIVDPMGQWAHPGEVTIIPGTDITMEGVDYPVLGISDTGDQQMMYPGEDYNFDGEYVTEYPMMKSGGWLSKFDTAQYGKSMFDPIFKEENKNRGDIASYFPEIQRMKDKPENEKAIVKNEQKVKQSILAKAVANAKGKQATITQDNRTPRQKEIAQQQVVNAYINEAQGSSPLAQTLSSFTPTGYNPEAGKIAAENVADMTPIMSGVRVSRAIRDPKNNPYGIGQGNGFLANTLGTLGLLGDAFDLGAVFSPALGSAFKQLTPLKNVPEKGGTTSNLMMNDVTPNVKSAWEPQELPGLHLSSTVEGGPISKIVEPKTGLVNVEQALGIIAKESGGASKASIIKKALGKDVPKKMDYNDFRKTVQDQLIPLDKEVVSTYRSSYGIDNIGYNKANRDIILNRINNTKEEIRALEASGTGDDYLDILKRNLEIDLRDYNNLPLENQTIRLSNKDKFGRGADAHDNPMETLGHIHFIRDSESPDVLTMTQMQSDAFQGRYRSMPKSLEEAELSLQSLENIATQRNNVLESLKKQKEELLINKADKETISQIDEEIDKFTEIVKEQNASSKFKRAEVENFEQKSLLDKNHQERYLQELVDYAGKRGDVNKVRVPTSETAAKVQGYEGVESEEIIRRYNEELAQNPNFTKELTDKSTEHERKLINDVLSGKLKGKIYEPNAVTILKKYTEQPKLIKKLFGQEVKIVTDSKGNTWYEFDIPERFKSGKGEIKAFKDGGWLNKYK